MRSSCDDSRVRGRAALVAATGVLALVGVTLSGWWGTDQLVRWLHAGRPVHAVEFANLLPDLTLVEVYCGDGTRAMYWNPGVPQVDENELYRTWCAKPPPSTR
jgi:hypothetical protein